MAKGRSTTNYDDTGSIRELSNHTSVALDLSDQALTVLATLRET